MVLPRCSPSLVPGSTGVVTVQAGVSRFYYGKARWRPGSPRWRAGHIMVMPRCLPVLKMIAAGVNWDDTEMNRITAVANQCEPWPNCGCPGGVTVLPCEAPVCAARTARCRPCYPRFAPDHPGLSRSGHRCCHVLSRCHLVLPEI